MLLGKGNALRVDKGGKSLAVQEMQRDPIAENILKRYCDLDNYPEDTLAPYEEFTIGGKTYYFTPGGFLYRKEPVGTEEIGGFFCGYLTNEVWQLRSAAGPRGANRHHRR